MADSASAFRLLRRASMARWLLAAVLLALLSSACRTEPPPEPLDVVRNALAERQYDWARKLLDAELADDPSDALVWRLAGDAWMSGTLRSPSRAIEFWRRSLELEPRQDDLELKVAAALVALGDLDAGLEAVRRASGREARMLEATILLDLDPEAGLEVVHAVIASDGGARSDSAFVAARGLDRLGAEDAAVEMASRAWSLDPFDTKSLYLLARLRLRAGETDTASRLLQLHQELERARDETATEALRRMDAIGSQMPSDAALYRRRLAVLFLDAGRRAEAALLVESLVEEEWSSREAIDLAGLAQRAGRDDLAEMLLSEVWSATGETVESRRLRSDAIYGLAVLAYSQGDTVGASRRVAQCLDRDDRSGRCHCLAGRLAASERPDEAERHFATSLRFAPWNVECRLELASLLLHQDRRNEADALLIESPDDDPQLVRFRRLNGLS